MFGEGGIPAPEHVDKALAEFCEALLGKVRQSEVGWSWSMKNAPTLSLDPHAGLCHAQVHLLQEL